MAKLSRTALKGLVKECLVEILAEGLAMDAAKSRVSSVAPLTESRKRIVKKEPKRTKANIEAAQDRHSHLVDSLAGSDPVMQDIFNDTLRNTITAQSTVSENSSHAQRMVHGDTATKEMISSDPMALFEGSSSWASLAFSNTENS